MGIFYGDEGNDIYGGTPNADLIKGYGGEDTLSGGFGNDDIRAGADADAVNGEAGNDILKGGGGDDTLQGGVGNDLLIGGKAADTADGGVGDDTYRVTYKDLGTADTFTDTGTGGNDVVDATRVTQLMLTDDFDAAGSGIESIVGAGTTLLQIIGDGSAVNWDFTGIDLVNVSEITGSGVDDVITGSDGDDKVKSGGGNDQVNGGSGVDNLSGGGGDDALDGGDEDDQVKGGGGDDTLLGGAGNDTLTGGEGSDTMNGGDGSDIYLYKVGESAVGDAFDDTGSSGTDVLDFSALEAVEMGNFVASGTGLEEIHGTATTGTAIFAGAAAVDWDFGGLTTENITLITGSGQDDVIAGSDSDDTLKGGGGDDSLDGGAGDDSVKGGGGDDTLAGGAGSDTLKGGGGNDTLVYDAADALVDGQDSIDTLSLDGSTNTTLDITSLAGITLKNIEVIDLANGGNTLVLDKASVNALSGTTDILTINGGASDTIIATADVWTQVGDEGSYHVYFNGTTFLRVLDEINAKLINTPGNDAPYARDNVATTDEDSSFTTGNVLANDADADGNALSVSAVDATSAGGALITDNLDGTFDYDPNGMSDSLDDGETAIDTFTYTISDGNGGTDTATVTVTITGANDAPVITSNGGGATAGVNVAEDSTSVTTVTATDVDVETLTFTISGGADSSFFTINTATGALSFASAPDFENAQDTGGNNVYDVQVTASDGTDTDVQDIAVTVTNVSDGFPPVITSNGGGDSAGVNVAENTTAVTTVTATDADLDTVTFSITGGSDASFFTINTATGALSFTSAPNFETPTDAGGNNVYDVQVTASDGTNTDDQDIAVTVTDVNEAPVITSNGGGATASVNVAENSTTVTTVTATDPDLDTLTYTISGGADALFFTINTATGALSFASAPDFESAADAGGNNVYDVQVTASDGTLTDVQDIAVTVTAVNDNSPAITSNGGGATASINVAENSTAVTTVAATDADLPAQSLTYTISGGADSTFFTINTATGALSFASAPDFETPADAGGNNVYDVTVTASEGTNTDSQDIAVTVTDVNEAPVITSNGGGNTASVNVAENSTAVTTVTATDVDLDTLTYTISGGADSSFFTINTATGALSFASAPDFESAADAGGNNVYDVQVTASDGTLTDVQDIAVTVTGVNDNTPVITSNGGGATASVNVAENSTAVTTVTATDADLPAQSLTYTITGGSDAGSFTINTATGALSFSAAPDFEVPGDAGGNNVYDVTVTASDGTNTDVQDIAVTVTGVNDNTPVITSNGGGNTASVNVAENSTAVTTVTATDADLDTVTFSISGGSDAAFFTINTATGALSFSAAPDFESAADAGGNNVYDVTVTASDGTNTDSQDIAVTVTGVNDNSPVITSNGGGNTASVNVAENSTAVTTVTATDADLDTVTFAITGGSDAGSFTINTATGALSFSAAPDFEVPGDAGGNNVYDVQVTASDGTNTDTQSIAVTVTGVNDNSPVITSNGSGNTASVNVAENSTAVTTVTATDADLDTVTFAITGGSDAAFFTINTATGALSFSAAPDFESAADAGGNNVYDVTVTASDGTNTDSQDIAVTVTGVNDNSPVITSNGGGATASVNVAENSTAVTTVTATDADLPGDTITYTITGGSDAGSFTINTATGALSFASAPDFETPGDAGADNVYDVTVTASDGTNTDSQDIAITVTDVNEAPVITSNGGGATASVNVAENSTTVTTVTATDVDLDTVTFAISGGSDAAFFTINTATGALSFSSAPDFEVPGDAGGNNVYDVQVTASDGALTDVQDIAVTVTGVNDNTPVITSNGGGATASVSMAENTTAVTTVTATDADLDTVTFAITGGSDAASFTINTATGALSFSAAPDFEVPGDAGGNNVYDVQVTASDGTNTDSQDIAVTVTDGAENFAPVITSNGGGATASVNVAENSTVVTTVTATDADLDTVTFAITGGSDAAFFTINTATGALSFSAAPDFEAPGDAGGNNVYDVTVTASDGTDTDSQDIAVTVTGVNDNTPVITSNGGGATASVNVAENSTVVTTVTATDADLDTVTFAITGGSDAASFTINTATGALSFAFAPDFESAADAGGNNVYDVTVTASDGTNTDSQDIAVTVTGVNDNPPVITSNGGGNTASVNVAENSTAVTTVTATDADLDTVTFAITGGSDAAFFTINTATGALSFSAAPDFEVPGDAGGNNVYDVQVTASDGTNTDSQDIAVTVTGVNDNSPVITSNGGGNTASVNVAENSTAVTTVTATDADLDTVTFAITGGSDAAFFTINTATGALSFSAAPDFEVPGDAGGNNVYDVQVTASDGTNTDSQDIAVTVTAVNDNTPVITSNGGGNTASVNVAENSTAVTTVTATDADLPGDTITYTITGGSDAAFFTINTATGALSFTSAPDFEVPGDAGGNNVYDVTVTASDGTNTDVQDIAVTVTGVNDNTPVITSNGGGATASVNVTENSTAVTTVTATDADLDTVTFAITGGSDAGSFTINTATGELSFSAAPDFESPADAGGNNVYDVQVTASDGTNTDSQDIAVTVMDGAENIPPVITSNGGGATASVNVAENSAAVTTVTATDADLDTVTFSISGGSDAAFFTINTATGALSFASAPDFETPVDAGGNNVYDVQVTASDGIDTDVQDIAVTVTDVNEAPVITSDGGGATASVNVAENSTAVTTVTATDPDLDTVTFAITGGSDAGSFTINTATGALSFTSAPDFESPADAGGNNVYDVQVTASDGTNNDVQDIAVTVTAVNDNTPSITSNGGGATASVNVAENSTAVTTVTATDADLPGDTLTYTITGGTDAAFFTINTATGALSFTSAPDFESAADAGGNNVYDVTVTTSDGTNTDSQDLAVTVTAVNDNTPVITSNGGGATAGVNVAENSTSVTTVTATDADLPGDTLTYTITGGTDAAFFTINTATGALSFTSAPDFESPADAGGNNVYDVQVTASDGTNTDVQDIAVTVTGVNDNTPVITSNGGGATAGVNVAENTTAVTTVTATDADLPVDTITYTITGGSDAGSFTINTATGALSFSAAPDFESAADAGGNNVYDVQVTASDGTNTDSQDIAVTVTAVNDNTPVITSNGGGATAGVNVAENSTSVTTVTATDADLPGDTITYTITGGSDAGSFTINTVTGALSFSAAPDFETPLDVGADNVYDVTVTASDGTNTDVQDIAVTVTNANDNSPVITSNGGGATASVNVAENSTAVTTVTATDADLDTVTFAITGGSDAGSFTINTATGALSFSAAPDFEVPGDAGGNNVYDVQVTASDGTNTDSQEIAVTVTAVNDNTPVITSNGGGATAGVNVAENSTSVTTVTATDADLPGDTLTYTITGGTDAAFFTINTATGALSFTSAPDFESPADAGGNNVYDVQVTASDGTNTDVQDIAVTVTDVNEAPVITSNGGGATASVNVAENSTSVTTVTATDVDLDTVTFAITGGSDAGSFTINTATGALSFTSAPDFEAPGDAGGNNVYDVQVTASDGALTDVQDIAVTVTGVNDNTPVITSNGGGATASVNVAENSTAVTTVTATDADLPGDTITYTITGGSDAGSFTINTATGALSFSSAPDFETPADAGGNNVYDVEVTASDGTNTDIQDIAVTVTAVNDNTPVITSNGGGATASVNVAENSTAVTTVTATDADDPGDTLTYTITGGSDSAFFSINTATGALTFASAPDFETPADAGTDNVYDVQVTASDGTNSDVQDIAVTVTDVNEAPTVTAQSLGTVNEGSTTVVTSAMLNATDPESATLTWTETTGSTRGYFALGATPGIEITSFTQADVDGGLVVFVATTDTSVSGGANSFDATMSVDDGVNTVSSVTFSVTLNDDAVTATAGADTLNGGNGPSYMDGGAGADTLNGGAGADTLVDSDPTATTDTLNGNAGTDTLTASGGDDVLNGGNGTDIMDGGADNDIYLIDAGQHPAAEITDSSGTADEVRFISTAAATLTIFAGDTGLEIVRISDASGVGTGTSAENIDASAAANSLTLIGNDGANNIIGSSFANNITGGAGDDTLTSGTGIDSLVGGADNDTLVFGTSLTAADTANGGSGTADTLTFTDNGTGVTDLNGVTNVEIITLGNAVTIVTTQDTLVAASATLAVNASAAVNLTWDGSAELDGTFSITGSTGADTLTGGGLNDTFVMGGNMAGTDTVNGGAGTADTLTFTDSGAATTDLDLVTNVETITLGNATTSVTTVDALVAAAATLTVNASALTGANTLTWNGAAESNGNFNITGGAGDDVITGGAGSDTVSGGAGNDTITAGAGTDNLTGGADNDTFVFGSNLASADIVDGGTGTVDTLTYTDAGATNELDNVTNIDVITLGNATTSVTTVDALVAAAATLTVNASALTGANTLTWNGAGETNGNFNITGGAGDDVITGGAGSDTVSGGAGNDTVTAGTGSDNLSGGVDNDTFVLGTNLASGDIVDGGTGTVDTLTFTDTGAATTDLDGVTNVEFITLGAAATSVTTVNALVAASALLTVNGSAATSLVWNGAAETDGAFSITGTAGADTLTGGSQNDTFVMGGNMLISDTLNGGAGTADTLTFTDNGSAVTDLNGVTNVEVITLGAAVTSVTTVDALVAASALLSVNGSAALGLTWNGTLETDGSFIITGSSLADTLTGGSQNDTFIMGGNLNLSDTINGGAGTADTLTFTDSNGAVTDLNGVTNVEIITLGAALTSVTTLDAVVAAGATLTVNGGAATNMTWNGTLESNGSFNITGSTGADTLTGGALNDTFVMGGNLDLNDQVDGGAGTADTLTFTDSGVATTELQFVSNVEFITLGDATTSVTTSNSLVAAGVTLTVSGGSLTATHSLTWDGSAESNGSFFILSGAGADTITGGSLADTLSGGDGVDTISGGLSADTIAGGNGDDVLDGGAGDDTLAGGLGNDTITADLGNDFFVFNTAPGAGNIDTLNGKYNGLGLDIIQLDNSIFTALGPDGALDATEYFEGAGATAGADASDRIIYNTTTGALYYDADGNGAGASIQIAILLDGGIAATGGNMSQADFVII